MFSDTLNYFRPDSFDLLRQISPVIDDGMLEEIAAADYGRSIQAHLAKLAEIRDASKIDAPMEWEPKEVLELVRWSEPDNPEWKPGGYGERGHWMRAFCCTALLSAASIKENYELREGWNSTVIQLLDSLASLGGKFYGPAASLLASLVMTFESDEESEELAFIALGLLWLAVQFHPLVSDGLILSLVDWIRMRESTQPQDIEKQKYSGRWLLGTTFHDIRHASWERLGSSLQDSDFSDRSFAARKQLEWLGSQLVDPRDN